MFLRQKQKQNRHLQEWRNRWKFLKKSLERLFLAGYSKKTIIKMVKDIFKELRRKQRE